MENAIAANSYRLRKMAFLLCLLCALAVSACTSTQTPTPILTPTVPIPTIMPSHPCELVPGATIPMAVMGVPGTGIAYSWNASAGTVTPPDGPTVVFTAPNVGGDVIIRVVAQRGNETSTGMITCKVLVTPSPSPTITVAPSPTPTPAVNLTPMAEPKAASTLTLTAWITNPLANSQVAQFTTVTGGYSADLTEDIWIFVQDSGGRYYPATMFLHQETDDCKVEGVVKRDGQWEMPALFGDSKSVGKAFNILLTTASPAASQLISEKQRTFCLIRDFPGFQTLPDGITVIQRVKVIRGSEVGGPLPDVLNAQLPATGIASLTNVTDQNKLASNTMITGTQTGLTGNIWVLVYVYNGRWYPQSIDPCLSDHIRIENDQWWTKVGLGGKEDIGRPFDIVVIVADNNANRFFEETQAVGCRDNYYPGLRTLQLPKGIAVMSRYRVYRK